MTSQRPFQDVSRFPDNSSAHTILLRRFSKVICFATLFLIFVGGLVTSTGSGLAVPDWPLSYGSLFPPMVGGVFYEHGHRMVAAGVGFAMLILTVLTAKWEKRLWVKKIACCALGIVILQGILGGVTVLFFLPAPVSIAHGVLAQTFFILTIILAYGQSLEREQRNKGKKETFFQKKIIKISILLTLAIYGQLIAGAVMRHTHSGLAIPDFPTMGGQWWPVFDAKMLSGINEMRFNMDIEPVVTEQVAIHFIHRLGALIVAALCGLLNFIAFSKDRQSTIFRNSLYLLNLLVAAQIALGAAVILTGKAPYLTTLHVATGAATLGAGVLLLLRIFPLTLPEAKKIFKYQ